MLLTDYQLLLLLPRAREGCEKLERGTKKEPQQLATRNSLHRHEQATACLDRQLGGERRGGSKGSRMGGISDEVWVDGRTDVNTCRVGWADGNGKRKGKGKVKKWEGVGRIGACEKRRFDVCMG